MNGYTSSMKSITFDIFRKCFMGFLGSLYDHRAFSVGNSTRRHEILHYDMIFAKKQFVAWLPMRRIAARFNC